MLCFLFGIVTSAPQADMCFLWICLKRNWEYQMDPPLKCDRESSLQIHMLKQKSGGSGNGDQYLFGLQFIFSQVCVDPSWKENLYYRRLDKEFWKSVKKKSGLPYMEQSAFSIHWHVSTPELTLESKQP